MASDRGVEALARTTVGKVERGAPAVLVEVGHEIVVVVDHLFQGAPRTSQMDSRSVQRRRDSAPEDSHTHTHTRRVDGGQPHVRAHHDARHICGVLQRRVRRLTAAGETASALDSSACACVRAAYRGVVGLALVLVVVGRVIVERQVLGHGTRDVLSVNAAHKDLGHCSKDEGRLRCSVCECVSKPLLLLLLRGEERNKRGRQCSACGRTVLLLLLLLRGDERKRKCATWRVFGLFAPHGSRGPLSAGYGALQPAVARCFSWYRAKLVARCGACAALLYQAHTTNTPSFASLLSSVVAARSID